MPNMRLKFVICFPLCSKQCTTYLWDYIILMNSLPCGKYIANDALCRGRRRAVAAAPPNILGEYMVLQILAGWISYLQT